LSQEGGIIGVSLCRNDALLNPIQFYLTSLGWGQFGPETTPFPLIGFFV